jgi:outer membrane protein assembly factor BamB
VYIAVGEDPEYGEAEGGLWCIDPTRRGDVSAELAVDANGKLLPRRRGQAVIAQDGERAIPNPNSAAVWHYHWDDRNGDRERDFEEMSHRSLGMPVIKDDILYIADFSGLVHCLNARSGSVYWTHDLLAACWGSALLADGKVYIGDEDGDVIVFQHGLGLQPKILATVDMGNSIYSTPIVANDILYITTRNRLFAISGEKRAAK